MFLFSRMKQEFGGAEDPHITGIHDVLNNEDESKEALEKNFEENFNVLDEKTEFLHQDLEYKKDQVREMRETLSSKKEYLEYLTYYNNKNSSQN